MNDKSTSTDNAWHLVANGDWLAGQRFPITSHAVLGRDSDCDITIPGTHLSRRHAEIAVSSNKLIVRDLDSSNGTYVNEERVSEIELKHGDEVRFDVLTFRIEGPQQEPDHNATMIREVKHTPRAKAKVNTKPATEKQWKTKPTAVGNRDKTIAITTKQKAVSGIWTFLAAVVAIGTLAALGYLITQL